MVIPEDKLKHLGAGFLCGLVVAFLAGAVGFNPQNSVFIGSGAGLALGIGKEIYDSLHPDLHTVDLMDAAATTLGGVLGSLVTLVF